ncbi:MAG: hypothetical protein RLZZ350_1812 [Verrucomicrobiota bacterium]|jgi:hypothetical protein
MNAYVKKEIRLLLPEFAAAILTAIVSAWMKSRWPALPNLADAYLALTVVSALWLGITSFGCEFNNNAFGALLAQPITKLRVWRIKMSCLAAAYALITLAWFVALKIDAVENASGNAFYIFGAASVFQLGVLQSLAMICGALCFTLLLRQTASAFWFALLLPIFGNLIVTAVATWLWGGATSKMTATFLLGYSAITFFFARRLFLRAQDVAWTDGELVVPELRGLARFKSVSATTRPRRPRAALLVKEFQLHQAYVLLAGALALLHLGVLAARKFGNFAYNSEARFALEAFWTLWLVMPLGVGCAAVAEERKLGTLEAQLCLPVKRRTQFALKLAVVLLLSVLLGAVMPYLFEGKRILMTAPHLSAEFEKMVSQSASANWTLEIIREILWASPSLVLFVAPAIIGALAFFVSTLTRNTLQAFAPAMLLCFAAAALLGTAWLPEGLFQYPLWRGALIYFIGVPLLLVALVRLAFGNFQRVRVAGALWFRNALTLLAAVAFAMTLTTALYHRAWEFLPGSEPTHGVARIASPRGVELKISPNLKLIARLPDGRVWLGRLDFPFERLLPFARLDLKVEGKFLAGAGWQDASVGIWDTVAIRLDGSLWVSEANESYAATNWWKMPVPASMTQLHQLGSDHDWKQVLALRTSAFLLKTDGSLWELGTHDFEFSKTNHWPGLEKFTPHRLGTDSDWATMGSFSYRIYFRKRDGELWIAPMENGMNAKIVNGHPWRVGYVFIGSLSNSTSFVWRTEAHGETGDPDWGKGRFRVGVGDDGTLRVWADYVFKEWTSPNTTLTVHHPTREFCLNAQDIRLGNETNWLAVASDEESVVALKSDGSLWHWHFPVGSTSQLATAYATQLGTRTDWLGIVGTYAGVTTLAADGSLWHWQFDSPCGYLGSHSDNENAMLDPLLGFSRHPHRLGNIFDAEK